MTHINAAPGKSAYAFDRLAPRPAEELGDLGTRRSPTAIVAWAATSPNATS